ncbi:amino-acid acetyltransferase [Novimethylophilus kurashikiensis]|uniref:Amino-acid acetyltransferase n=1 Tax=Novimethylophilus kurashikiensis TaxID=1825523 RepID=A0A2R5F8M8_9PROT|nr:helix-turn-helix transcriptional regulator [Novimethylophilus kurashikiensis]GBG14576.1 amino-acid acetyltransferase [Novimethylophilus kurashikiensis]
MDTIERGILIQATRKAQKKTMYQLAKEAGIGIQTLVRLEAGNLGIGQGIVDSVLGVLGLSLEPADKRKLYPGSALHPLHVESNQVEQVVKDAVMAACAELDKLFPGAKPEVDGINSSFAGVLEANIKAMLCGHPVDVRRNRTPLPKLVWSDYDFGTPFNLPEGAQGYMVIIDGMDLVLEPSNYYSHDPFTEAWRPARRCTDLFSSWMAAAEGIRLYIEQAGQVPGEPRIIAGVFTPNDGVAPFEPTQAE